jgi:hypothetical protein
MQRWLECVRSYENECSGALSSLQLDPAVPVPGPYGGSPSVIVLSFGFLHR